MKIVSAIIVTALFIGSASSCVVFTGPKHDNGKHAGWYKNPNNPHNPAHTAAKPGAPKGGNGNGKQKGK